jgi:hypothetical protein
MAATAMKTVIWIGISLCFVRGLFVFDMGGSAEKTYPTASAICLTGAVIAAALMYVAETLQRRSLV